MYAVVEEPIYTVLDAEVRRQKTTEKIINKYFRLIA